MTLRSTRRRFLQETSALAVSAYVAGSGLPAQPRPADRINIGVIACAGQAGFNIGGVRNEAIVALCDVDENRAAPVRKQFPKAAFYTDYRQMLDKQKDLQAVVISTPDHHHAFAALAAMRRGQHVYCEKPLTHSVYEVRQMMETAAKQKVVTQMGTQIHAGENYRRVVEIVQAGVLGNIRRVHVWCDKRPDARTRSAKPVPPPKGLNYDLWIGPAPFRPYDAAHLHFHWRWFWDFGGGMLADMACHYMDLPHWALNLRAPTTISSTGRILNKSAIDVPDVQQVDFEYPARGNQPVVHLTWYHGVRGPDLDGKVHHKGFSSGVLFVGDKGSLLANYGSHRFVGDGALQRPKPTIPPSLGHHREWLEAIRNGGATTCNFAHSGALTEAVLLGNVAYHLGARIQYDAKTGRVANMKAAQYLRREYRKGWML